MAGIVSVLTKDGTRQVDEGGSGVSWPGLESGGEGERAVVEGVLAALPGDEGVEGGEGTSFAGQGEAVGGRAFAGPGPGGQAGQLSQARGSVGVVPG